MFKCYPSAGGAEHLQKSALRIDRMQRVAKLTKNCLPELSRLGSSARSQPEDLRHDELTAIQSNRQQVMESLD
ncbi:hypothetical protein ACNKHN_00310 [Shigella flexneri]